MQIGLAKSGLKKLQSCLVAAEAACSTGDLPVVTVDAMLVAVTGLATAAVAMLVPALLDKAVPEAPIAAIGATQALRKIFTKREPTMMPALVDRVVKLLSTASNAKNSSGPGSIGDCFKSTIRGFLVNN